MTPILLKPLLHRPAEQIAICFMPASDINRPVRQLKGVKWSQTQKCWYMPLRKESFTEIKHKLAAFALDSTRLKRYLEKKRQVKATLTEEPGGEPTVAISSSKVWKLTAENLAALKTFVETLVLKAYSPSTIKTYRNEFVQLLQLLKQKPVHQLTPAHLRRYFLYCSEKLQLTENSLHSRINAIKFYFEQVLHREKFF